MTRETKRFRPRGGIFENVPDLIDQDGGKLFDEVLDRFKAAGYVVKWAVLVSTRWGLCAHSKRLCILVLCTDVAAAVNFEQFGVLEAPVVGAPESYKCIDDILDQRGEEGNGVRWLEASEVDWFKNHAMPQDAWRLPGVDRSKPARTVTLGKVRGGDSAVGDKVISSHHALCRLTAGKGRLGGLGQGAPFVYIHARKQIRTLSTQELLRAYGDAQMKLSTTWNTDVRFPGVRCYDEAHSEITNATPSKPFEDNALRRRRLQATAALP